jgi:hypothetical protein
MLPVVWGTWKAVFELLQPNEVEPSEWDSCEAVTPASDGEKLVGGGKTKILCSLSKMDPMFEDFNQADDGIIRGPLIDQNREYVRYEIRLNKDLYCYIREKEFYKHSVLTDLDNHLEFPVGSIEVKAAWRVLPENLRDRYYCVTATLVDPPLADQTERQITTRLMGLVGLHIVHKTPTRPDWIWCTFEHVDNVPDNPTNPGDTAYSFFDRNGELHPRGGFGYEPASVRRCQPLIDSSKRDPVQVIRLESIRDSTQQANHYWQNHPQVRDTVWKHYRLVATQWKNKNGIVSPTNGIANVTMETYVQDTSCITCHNSPSSAKLVFFLSNRVGNPDDTSRISCHQAVEDFMPKRKTATHAK